MGRDLHPWEVMSLQPIPARKIPTLILGRDKSYSEIQLNLLVSLVRTISTPY